MKHTSHSNIYILERKTFKRMENNSTTFPNCYYCTIPFKLGDEVYSKVGACARNRHFYHKKCAEQVNLI